MDSRSKSPLSLLHSEPRADLLTGFLPSGAFELLGSHLPGELLLEGECTPGTAWFDLLGPQPQQQQIGHDGDRDRALDARRIFCDLMLAQAHPPLQLLNAKFHGPSSEVARHGRVSCSLRQIGHQQLGVLGAVVTPPSAQYYGDISDLPQLRTLGKG